MVSIATTKERNTQTDNEALRSFKNIPVTDSSLPRTKIHSAHNSKSSTPRKHNILKLAFANTKKSFNMKLSIQRPSMPSFRKSVKKDEADAEVSTTVTKVPRKGMLGKMGLKKKTKAAKEESTPEPVEEPVTEEPASEEAVAEEEPVDAPEAEEAVEEREEEPAEEPVEEAAEESPEEPSAPVEEAAETREQPESTTPISTGFLCGCV